MNEIEAHNANYGRYNKKVDTLFVQRLRLQLNDNEIAYVLGTMRHICNNCWDVDVDKNFCYCTSDD